MDIRFINSANEIINASRLSIKAMNKALIGIDEERNVVLIERYGSEEEAKEVLKGIVKMLSGGYYMGNAQDCLIDLRKEEEDGESKQDKEEYKNPEGDK